jgi:hypothetical protein
MVHIYRVQHLAYNLVTIFTFCFEHLTVRFHLYEYLQQSISNEIRVYPKYSGLVPPSIQQLWQREVPVDSRTTKYSESVCQI